jgi:hypothetical protein
MDSPSALKWITLILILGCAVWVVARYLKWVTTNFVITSDRVIYRSGVFAKSGIEIPLERVNSVHSASRSSSAWSEPATCSSNRAPKADSNDSKTSTTPTRSRT